MNESTRCGLQELLSILDDSTLQSLACTVTTGLLKNKMESREDAIRAIIDYSSDSQSLLRRKAITKETLFTYVHRRGIAVTLPATKNSLVEHVTAYWNNAMQVEEVQCEAPVSSLAQEFCNWFYGLLNSNGINAEVFYPDAWMKINVLYTDRNAECECVQGNSQQLALRLLEIKSEHCLYFNPNVTSEGVQGRVDPHGLVMVLACGTLHSNDACVGVFQQVFGLIRDPSVGNNWKIKSTELNLTSGNAIQTPRLCESDLTGRYLSLPMV